VTLGHVNIYMYFFLSTFVSRIVYLRYSGVSVLVGKEGSD